MIGMGHRRIRNLKSRAARGKRGGNPILKISMCEKNERPRRTGETGKQDHHHSLHQYSNFQKWKLSGTSQPGNQQHWCLLSVRHTDKIQNPPSSLHMLCHHGVRRCQHSLMQQDRCWLLALRPDQVTQL